MPVPLPETILQFGSGRFLRAFADLFIHQANNRNQRVGRVVVVQSTAADRAGALADIERATHLFSKQEDTENHQKSIHLHAKIKTYFID